MRLAAALVAAVAAATPGLFRYDHALSFGVNTLAVAHRSDGITVREISFRVDRSTREKAFLVVPPGRGPHPGIVFYPGRWATRSWFLPEAVADARRGVVSISLDDLSTDYPRFTLADRAALALRVVTGLRALDLLASLRGVDSARIGLVGHSDGAEMAGMIAGFDHRLRAVVLMSGGGIWDRSGSAAYDRAIEPYDADNFVGHATAPLFFQNALSDQYVPRQEAAEFQRTGSAPKRIEWYAATHVLDAQAERDRTAWLARQLGF